MFPALQRKERSGIRFLKDFFVVVRTGCDDTDWTMALLGLKNKIPTLFRKGRERWMGHPGTPEFRPYRKPSVGMAECSGGEPGPGWQGLVVVLKGFGHFPQED